jgi:hypothetical protein
MRNMRVKRPGDGIGLWKEAPSKRCSKKDAQCNLPQKRPVDTRSFVPIDQLGQAYDDAPWR